VDVAADPAGGTNDLDAPRTKEVVEVHGGVVGRGERRHEAIFTQPITSLRQYASAGACVSLP